MRIAPEPNPEEIAALMAALAVVWKDRAEPEENVALKRSRWRQAGLLGHAPPREMKLEGTLWAYLSWRA